jgi:hypothetical protein
MLMCVDIISIFFFKGNQMVFRNGCPLSTRGHDVMPLMEARHAAVH